MGVFEKYKSDLRGAYANGLNTLLLSPLQKQKTYSVSVNPNAALRIVQNGEDITVHVTLTPETPSGGRTPEHGFVITPMVDGAPDYEHTVVYDYNFDNMQSTVTPNMRAGNRMVWDDEYKFGVSYDGTGGGDIDQEPGRLGTPGHGLTPFGYMSSFVYAEGVEYDMSVGDIYGIGVTRGMLYLAVFDGAVVTILQTGITMEGDYISSISAPDQTNPASVVGTFAADARRVAVFSADCAKVAYGNTEFNLVTKATSQLSSLVNADYTMLWSAFDAAGGARVTLKHIVETRSGIPGCFPPIGVASEYTHAPIITGGKIIEAREYYALDDPNALPATPSYKTTITTAVKCTPMAMPRMIYLTLSLISEIRWVWFKTIHQEQYNAVGTDYTYKDFRTGEFVRMEWRADIMNVYTYGQGSAVVSYGVPTNIVEINKQAFKVIGASGQAWAYTTANGQGDFILRKKPTGVNSSCLLVSPKGATIQLDDTYKVGIF